jgi:DNA-binding IclR family transcriptional regulator
MPHGELVQSLLRAIDVIELLAHSERGLSLSEVCNALSLKQPTAHNLIRTLVAREYVEKTNSPVRYRLGPAMSRMAAQRHHHTVVRHASQLLNELFERLRQLLPPKLGPTEEATLSFHEFVGGEVTMMLRLRMQRPGVLERPMHAMSPYQSAAALTYQAMWSPEELDNYRKSHSFLDQGAPIWKTQESLDSFLHEARELGYCRPPIYPPGQVRVAVPVYGEGHRLIGVVGAGIWSKNGPVDVKKLIKEMLQVGGRLGEEGSGET